MKKVIDAFRQLLAAELLSMRSQRQSRFLYLPANIGLGVLSQTFLYESLGKFELSDKLLINTTIKYLVDNKILLENPISYTKNKIEDGLFYHDVYLRTFDNGSYCRGTSTDFATAFAKAVGEVFERTSIKYPSRANQQDDMTEKVLIDVRGDKGYINFDLLPKPTNAQLERFPNFQVKEEDSFEFIKVKKLSGESIYIPTQTIFFGPRKKSEKVLLQSTTHGAGAGYCFDMAFNSAVFEVLHRHFFLKSWYHKTSPDILKLDSLDPNAELSRKIRILESRGFKIHMLDFRKEAQVPTFICLLEKHGGLYCGGSSSLDLFYAIERSIDEAMSTYYWEVGKLLEGSNNLNQAKIDNLQSDFLDTTLDGGLRVQVFASSYFAGKKLDKFFLKGRVVTVDEYKFDKNNFDLHEYIQKVFGDEVYYYQASNQFMDDFNYTTVKVYIPNSYYFPLNEMYARPILQDGVLPTNTSVNPFP